jgi:hypothetical protein
MNKRTFKEESDLILKGLEKAYEKMVKLKKEKNTPLVVSKNGHVIKIPADEILPTTLYSR